MCCLLLLLGMQLSDHYTLPNPRSSPHVAACCTLIDGMQSFDDSLCGGSVVPVLSSTRRREVRVEQTTTTTALQLEGGASSDVRDFGLLYRTQRGIARKMHLISGK